MAFQMNPDQLTGLLNNYSRSSLGYRENPGAWFGPIVTDIFVEPIRDFQLQKCNLCLISALGVSNDYLSIQNILRSEFKDLADTQAAAGHSFEHQPVSWISGSENDLVDHVLFQNIELSWFAGFEKFL
jgi:hypothetical protein